AALAEHLHVGVPKAVDRLELVTDEEDLLRGPRGQQIDEFALERVRVLELVDHDRAESELLRLANLARIPEKIAREELQVLEVERGLAPFRRSILGPEQVEQLLQKLLVARREHLERGLLDTLARVVVGLRARPRGAQRREVEQQLGIRAECESAAGGRVLVLGRVR